MGWFIHHCSSGLVLATQLQARSNHKDDCQRVLVPKSQVENILQCFGLIFILMDRLGALLSTLGANLVKERFFRDTLYFFKAVFIGMPIFGPYPTNPTLLTVKIQIVNSL